MLVSAGSSAIYRLILPLCFESPFELLTRFREEIEIAIHWNPLSDALKRYFAVQFLRHTGCQKKKCTANSSGSIWKRKRDRESDIRRLINRNVYD